MSVYSVKGTEPFDWNMEIRPDVILQPSEYKRVYIGIHGDYQMGTGWNRQQANAFHTEVHNKLRSYGFTVNEPNDNSGSCAELSKGYKFDKTYLYLHPMEFTGYLKDEDCEKVLSALSECKCIKDYTLKYQQECYDLNDVQYSNLITQNAIGIINRFKDNYGDARHDVIDSFAWEFAMRNNIQRVGDGAGFSSDNIGYNTIKNILTVAKELGALDKEKSKTKEPKRKEVER